MLALRLLTSDMSRRVVANLQFVFENKLVWIFLGPDVVGVYVHGNERKAESVELRI
jgi:hypothetical protein